MLDDDLQTFLAGAAISPAVAALRPDYRALLVAVRGVAPLPSDSHSEALLVAAEESARAALAAQPVDELPHVAAWREAYRSFGAKPQRTRNSLEALLRRATGGLPRVNRLTDLYNAVSVLHQIPLGGEDLDHYSGSPVLVRADGTELFDTISDGRPVDENPEVGEVVWRDDHGITCRRWNWRQCYRTRLREETTSVLFILDALSPVDDSALQGAVDHLLDVLQSPGTTLESESRLLGSS